MEVGGPLEPSSLITRRTVRAWMASLMTKALQEGGTEEEGRNEKEKGGDVRTEGGRGRSIDAFSLPTSPSLCTYLSFAPPPGPITLGPPPPPPRLGAGAAVGRVVLMPLLLQLPFGPMSGSGRRAGLSCLVLLLDVAMAQTLLLPKVLGVELVVVVGWRAARRRTRGSMMTMVRRRTSAPSLSRAKPRAPVDGVLKDVE